MIESFVDRAEDLPDALNEAVASGLPSNIFTGLT